MTQSTDQLLHGRQFALLHGRLLLQRRSAAARHLGSCASASTLLQRGSRAACLARAATASSVLSTATRLNWLDRSLATEPSAATFLEGEGRAGSDGKLPPTPALWLIHFWSSSRNESTRGLMVLTLCLSVQCGVQFQHAATAAAVVVCCCFL